MAYQKANSQDTVSKMGHWVNITGSALPLMNKFVPFFPATLIEKKRCHSI